MNRLAFERAGHDERSGKPTAEADTLRVIKIAGASGIRYAENSAREHAPGLKECSGRGDVQAHSRCVRSSNEMS
jgi:hypothetical protein